MSNMYNSFEGDATLENEGIWLDYGEFRIRASYAGGANKAYNKCLDAKTKHIRRAISTGSIQDHILNNILINVYAETVIKDWQVISEENGEWKVGIPDKEGNLMPFNSQNVIKTFKALPHLFENVRDAVSNATLYRKEVLEDESKNL